MGRGGGGAHVQLWHSGKEVKGPEVYRHPWLHGSLSQP